MDKNKIKTFAIWARRNLISAVSERANRIGVTENNVEKAVSVQGGFKLEGNDEIFKLSKAHRDKLVKEVNEKGFEQVMEEVAYTWFNRFMGLRYMEVNEYLPTGVRVLSSEVEGKTEPDVLTRVSEVIEELKLNSEYIYELLDSGKTEDREEAYKHILVKQCNELGKIIPQMFEKISDYTELLLPDNLLEEGSVIRKMVEDIVEEDWKEEVEIIGWMYQYYISEKKDEVFAALKKNVKITKENIPAATQLFTPKWIVKYMVENSLGRLWLEGHPNEELQKEWKYYLEEAQQESEVEEELKKIRKEHASLTPEDIKVLDPCMGSGHILVYAFDVLYEIYKTAGYSEREIPRMILQKNLYGLDIDDRAAQLASFALIMKARHYNRRLFREMEIEHLELNLCSIQESNEISDLSLKYFTKKDRYYVEQETQVEEISWYSKLCSIDELDNIQNIDLETQVRYLVKSFYDAKEYGSILNIKELDLDAIEKRLQEITEEETLTYDMELKNNILEIIPPLLKQARIMSRKYEICVTNPPYMGLKGMEDKLKEYLTIKFNDSKSDMFAIFMDRIYMILKDNGLYSMINQQSWMFLSSYENLRNKIIDSSNIINMAHLGPRTFEEIGGEVVQSTTFTIRKTNVNNYITRILRCVDVKDAKLKEIKFLELSSRDTHKDIFNVNIFKFKQIPKSPFSYWVEDSIYKLFVNNKMIADLGKPCKGIDTGDNNKFLRLWHELIDNKICFGFKDYDKALTSKYDYYPYNKGGGYRKWYGNNEYVLFWGDDGRLLTNFKKSNLRNKDYYRKSGLTWSTVTTNKLSIRYFENGYYFDNGGCCLFIDNKNYYLGLLNSEVNNYIQQLSPTLNFQPGDIGRVPVIISEKSGVIDRLVDDNIFIAKVDWDLFETSWDFKIHPLLKLLDKGEQHSLSVIFRIWETECEEAFEQLKYNEEELNRIFIDIYGLQDELTPEVIDKDITIRKADRERDIKSFISYAVGCMLGRYSIDAEGLIYAGGDFKDKWNLEDNKVKKIEKDEEGNLISDSWVDATFMPDSDNVIPITEDEYFEDDIVSRFIEFVRIVYGEETVEENLDFIADSIGRKTSETARQAIRRYFIKDFYKDHLKVYRKRPIYWMFESGKNDGFKALVYMHRYNEQTVARVRTDYLHTLQRKYEAEMQRQQLVVDSEEYTAKDRTAASRKIDRIAKQIEECREYDQVVAHLANEKISIDLDDGVKVNYDKFQGVKVINSKGKEVKMDLLAKI